MQGRLYIDGQDLFTAYGIYATQKAWNALVAYPPLKKVESNDWQEYDGIEADLANPVLNTREIQITLASRGSWTSFEQLITLLSNGAYHVFDCRYIQRTYRLRLTQQSSHKAVNGLSLLTLNLADDFPLDGYSYVAPASTVFHFPHEYEIDGIPTTDYGVQVLQGSIPDIVKQPAVKQNLLRNLNILSGAIYDPQNVTYKTRTIKLKCLMRANTLAELWQNYDALLYDLIRPHTRRIAVLPISRTYNCYYTSCTVDGLSSEERIGIIFQLTFTVCEDIIEGGDEIILATETIDPVVQTENEYFLIDLRPDAGYPEPPIQHD